MMEPLVYELSKEGRRGYAYPASDVPPADALPLHLQRIAPPKLPELSELGVVRHFSHLAKITYGVDHGPYPLGSCTMKYNPKLHNHIAALEGLGALHPLQDAATAQGALAILYGLTE
ncbi:MAG: aminomethyl-transferring glycine dehydrogenase subunit GcvPB, partial [Sphaerochaeta sp.]|nr:aminomethyl-transferring glycine dehydrogenase subunit GcvPB [Sphaerochaeta sp.]